MKRLTLFLLFLLSIPLQSIRAQELERDPDFLAGRAALEDGFYDVAARRFEDFVNKTIVKRKKANGSIFMFRAWHGIGEQQKIINWLDENRKLAIGTRYESGYDFWYAQANYSLGNFDVALEYLNKFEERYPKDEFLPYALRLHALTLRDTGELEEAEKLFARFDREYGDRDEILDNLLDWSGVLIQMKQLDRAREKLQELVERFPENPITQRARLWLGQWALENDSPENASTWLLPLTTDTKVDASVRADAWLSIARSEVNQGNITNALAALVQGETLSTNVERKVEARIDQARLLMQLNRLDDAIAIMDQTVFTLSAQPQAGRAQLELSDLLRAQGQFEKAVDAYQRYLESFSDANGQRHALYSKAWSLWELHRYAEAALAFEKAYDNQRNQSLREQALVKAADAYFMNNQYRRAAETYEKALAEFQNSPSTADIMYQAAESYARSADATNAVRAFSVILEKFPERDIAQVGLLRLAHFFEEQREWESAVATYDEFLVRYSESERFPEALTGRAMLRYRNGKFKESMGDFERLLAEFPGTPWAERADFMRGWCLYQMGETDKAIQVGKTFIEKNKDSNWSAEVAFWLAEHEYNQQNYGVAETNFAAIAAFNPTNHLADKSLYWAGRSAFEQKGFRRAIDYYNQLIRFYTNSAMIPEARFAQGDTLTEIGDFAGAILAYDEIVKKYPGSPLFVRAVGRIGDCQFTLGSDRFDRYQEAATSYRTALTHPHITPDLVVQVEYKLARSYERLGRNSEALTHYLNVTYGWLASRNQGVPVEEVWFVRSAFAAAALKEAAQAWDDAIKIYERIVESGVTAGADAKIRMERIAADRQKAGSTSVPENRNITP